MNISDMIPDSVIEKLGKIKNDTDECGDTHEYSEQIHPDEVQVSGKQIHRPGIHVTS